MNKRISHHIIEAYNMRFLKLTTAVSLGAVLLLGVLAATDATAQTITRQVIGNGGTVITDGNGNRIFGGTIGQTIVGVGSREAGGSSDIYHGFWYFPKVSSAPTTGIDVTKTGLWNSPNPFTTSTTIHFDLTSRSSVRLRIFDMDGKLVRTLADDSYSGGTHQASWDATNDAGDQVAAGYYYYTLDAQPDQGGQSVNYQQKMLLVK